MKKLFAIFLLLFGLNAFCVEEKEKKEEPMTHTQELWGRKFQASLAYTYFSIGHQGVDVGCGVWDWTPLEWLSILPKIGYGAKVLEQNFDGNKAYHLSWEPTIGLDLIFSINSLYRSIL